MKSRKIITIIITIIVILIAASLGIYFGKKSRKTYSIADGIVISKEQGINYDTKFITNLNQYETFTKNYKLEKVAKKENMDFKLYDYIIDFIPYNSNLIIKDINLDVANEGVILKYNLNKKINDKEQLLIYTIPVKKNTIKKYKLIDHKFIYENEGK